MDALERLKALGRGLRELGYEKERTALAQLSLAFFGVLFVLVALGAEPGFGRVFVGLALCYLVAFMALGVQWFWARWFASGVAWSGFGLGLMLLVMIGWHPFFGAYTGLHALVIMLLMGGKMAARYELQTAWRERYAMDEYGVARLGKAVTRASASLPTLIMWALAPREGQGMELFSVLALLVGALAVAGLIRLRTWGVLAAAGVVLLIALMSLFAPELATVARQGGELGEYWTTLRSPALVAGLLGWALLPVTLPVWRYFRSLAPRR